MSVAIQDAATAIDHHFPGEMNGSGLLPETVEAAGVYVETDHHAIARILGWKSARNIGSCLVYPLFDRHGNNRGVFQVKPQHPLNGRKYETPKGQHNRIYFPPLPHCIEAAGTPDKLLAITEGIKKSLAASQCGIPALALAGVQNWSRRREKDADGKKTEERVLCDDLLDIDWRGRPVVIIFDTDTRRNQNVNLADATLTETLERHGATVKIVRFPVERLPGNSGFHKYGIDDWILAKGTKYLTIHEDVLSTLRPEIEIKGTPKTIATLETIIEAAQKLPSCKVLDDPTRRLYSWRLMEIAEKFRKIFQSDPQAIRNGPVAFSADASATGTSLDLYRLLKQSGIRGDGDALPATLKHLTKSHEMRAATKSFIVTFLSSVSLAPGLQKNAPSSSMTLLPVSNRFKKQPDYRSSTSRRLSQWPTSDGLSRFRLT